MRKATRGRRYIHTPIQKIVSTKFGDVKQTTGYSMKRAPKTGAGYPKLYKHIHHEREKELRKNLRRIPKSDYMGREHQRALIKENLYTGVIYSVDGEGTIIKDLRSDLVPVVRREDNPRQWHINQMNRQRKAA